MSLSLLINDESFKTPIEVAKFGTEMRVIFMNTFGKEALQQAFEEGKCP